MIEAKDILNWCFTVAALDFGVFGFLYSTYANAMFQIRVEQPEPPPITGALKQFCRVLTFILVVLTVLSMTISYNAGVGIPVWIIVGSFIILSTLAIVLSLKME